MNNVSSYIEVKLFILLQIIRVHIIYFMALFVFTNISMI